MHSRCRIAAVQEGLAVFVQGVPGPPVAIDIRIKDRGKEERQQDRIPSVANLRLKVLVLERRVGSWFETAGDFVF